MHDQLSFSDQERELHHQQRGITRVQKRLTAINTIVNWKKIESLLDSHFSRSVADQKKGGRPPYPAPMMIRILFLQYLYDLSDPETEDYLVDHLAFQHFVGLRSSDGIPDFTTVWRFKERLIRHDLLAKIFDRIVGDLESKGLVLKHGTIVDATIVETKKNRQLNEPERRLYVAQREALEPAEHQPADVQPIEAGASPAPSGSSLRRRLAQRDLDARCTRKIVGPYKKQYYYGYKGHIGVDQDSKLIRRHHFSPANEQDIDHYACLLAGDERAVYGDKAYQKRAHREEAEQRQVAYCVLRKGNKHHPDLSEEDRRYNRSHARIRGQVEHVFAHMKTKLSLRQVTAVGLNRNKLRFEMNCILYNIERALFLIRRQLKTA